MDRQAAEGVSPPGGERGITRRQVLKYGLGGAACLAAASAGGWYFLRRLPQAVAGSGGIFPGDAPTGATWELWKKRGWVRPARHCSQLGRNVQCKVCPNDCLLTPGDRGRCRNRVNVEGTLYTMVYGNPCSFLVDPIEKKPLMHFFPGSTVFSLATSGCGFRCLNCQNWEISQRKPEETKDPAGPEVRINPDNLGPFTREGLRRASMFPEDVVALTERLGCRSIAYTYTEPTSFYEYMCDTAALARRKKIKNVWVTCGYINEKPLKELCEHLDAANVDLKSFSEETYKTLNSGRLRPILDTLVTLKRLGVWFEVTNLVVPTYTDKPDMIARMCDWLLANIGPDYPLHFSRFHPAHRLEKLPPTPVEVLVEARGIARKAGLRHVYIGNVRGVDQAETTLCPACGRQVVIRDGYRVVTLDVVAGKCRYCSAPIAGVWS